MSTLPKTYRAAEVTEQGKLKVIDVPLKPLNNGEVLIKVEACGVCHSDCFTVEGGVLPVNTKRPGHEVIGRVVAVDKNAKRWKVGDRVGAGWHGYHCFECNSCQRGSFITCEKHLVTGLSKDGGYAEYLATGWESLARVPEGLDSKVAAPLMCAGVTVFNSLRSLKLSPGSVVAVIGIGGLGHLAIQFANRSGYRVVAISSGDDKKELAKELGAHHYINSKTQKVAEELLKLGGANAIIATAFSAKSQEEAFPGLAVDGTLMCLAPDRNPVGYPVGLAIGKRLGIRAFPSGSPIDAQDTLEFAELSNVKSYIQEYPLEKVQEAYDSMVAGKPRFRAVLTFP